MPGELPMPPVPSLSAVESTVWAFAGLVLGLMLLLAGRVCHRGFLVLAGTAIGYGVGGALGEALAANPWVARAFAMIVLAAAGLLLARMVWALAGAGAVAGLAALAILPACLGIDPRGHWPSFQPNLSSAGWLVDAFRCLGSVFQLELHTHPTATLATVVAAAGLPLVAFLLEPRAGAIFGTSLAGAAAMVGGVLLVLGRASPALWEAAWRRWPIPVGAAGVLFLASLVFQAYSAAEADRAQQARREPQKDESKPPRNAEQ